MARIRKKIGSDAVIYGRTQSKGNLESDSGLIIKEGENNPPILDTTGNAIEVRKGVNVDNAVTVDSLTIDNIGMYEQIVVTNNNGMLTASTISLQELESLDNINGNVQDQLDHEAGERAEADRVLTEGLARESSERADADDTLTNAIEEEADARQDADDSLSDRIDAEVNTRTSEVASLTNAIQTEADARLQEDTALDSKIDAEISDREEDVSTLNNAISGLTTQLTQEATARANKDSELQTAIENEATTRASDVGGLRSDLTDETSERIQAVSGLTEAINGEIADRQNADGVLQTAIENEARDRTNEDASLDHRLDAIEERIVLPWEGNDTLAKESDLNTAIGQVYTDLGSKVDKITATHSNTVAYVQTSGGNETYLPISATDTPNAIALRNAGGTIEVPLPVAGSEVANKSYVDSEIQPTREAIDDHIQDTNNPHGVTKEQVGLQYVENYPMDENPSPDSSNYVSSGGVYSAIDTVQGTVYAHTMDENNPHHVTKGQVGLGDVVNATMDSQPESGSMNYVESGGVYSAIQDVASSLQVHEDDTNNPHQVTKSQVGLGNVDNTSDADKPISSAQRDEFNAIQGVLDGHIDNISNPHQVTKTQVGLGYVENHPMDSTPSPSSSNYVSSGGVYTEIDRVEGLIDAHISDSSNPHNVTKTQIGLGNVDNTRDIDKPVSSAQQTAIDGVQSNLDDHEMDSNNPHNVTKSQVGLGNVDNTSDMDKPVSSLQSVAIGNVQSELDTHEQTYADATTYGHVKMDGSIGTGSRTDVTISEAGIKAYVNSSIGTSTADFLGTYNAVADLGFTQTVVDTWTDPPTSAVESTVGNAITTVLNAESITPTSNDYVFVSVNKSITTDIDWFWRFKFDGSAWLYEYTLNNSSFTQAQWDSINSGITNTKVGNYDTHIASRSNPHNVTKAQVGLGNVDNTSDLNKPISTATQTALDNKVGTVNQTGSGYVSAVAIDTTDKTKLNVTRTAIPNVAVTGGTAESNKYVSAIATNGHGITVTKATLPSLTKGTTSGSGNVVSDISVSGHQITLTKGITAITDVSNKMNTDMSNIAVSGTKSDGKTVVWDATNSQWAYGEAGKVDDVQLNGTSVVTNKIANLPAYPTVNNGTLNIQGNGTTAGSFTANATGTTNINLVGGGGTTVTADSTNKKITISTTLPTVNNGTLNLKGAGTTVATFTANQSGTSNLDIVGDGSTTVTPDATNKKITISTPVLSTVATSGSYNDLTNKPTIPTVNNGTLTIKGGNTSATTFTANSSTSPTLTISGSGGTTVTGASGTITVSTPVLSTVATSGSYNDLSNKPTIPTVNNGTLSIQGNGTTASQFTANQSGNTTLNIKGSGGTTVSKSADNEITISTGTIPTIPSITVGSSGTGNVISNVTASSHALTLTKSETLSATQTGGISKTYTSGANTTRVVLAQVQNYTGLASCRIKIEVGPDSSSGAKVAYIDAYWAGRGSRMTIESVYDWNNAIRYFFIVCPNNTSYYTSNPPEIHIQQNSAVARTIKATIVESTGNVVLMNNLTTAGNTTNRNTYTYDVNNTVGVYDNAGYVQNSGWSSGAWDRLDNDRYLYGEACVNTSLVARASDGKLWKLSRNDKEFLLPLDIGNCTGTFSANASWGRVCRSIRGLGWSNFTNTSAQTTAFTVPTLTVSDYGKTVYLVGTLSNGKFVSSRKITLSIDVPSSGSLTYIPIGKIDHTSENVASAVPTTWTLDTYNANAYTIDSNGKITHVNGLEINDPAIAWADITGKPTFSTVATSGSYNDLSNKPTIPTVNNGTLSIQGNGTTATTFTANSSTSPTLNIKGSGGTTVTKSADNEITISTGTIPTVNNGTLTIQGNGTNATTFTANSSTSPTLNIKGSGGTTVTGASGTVTVSSTAVNNGTLTIQGSGTTATTFSANSSTSPTLNIKGSGGTTVSKSADNEITINTGTIPTVNNGTLTITQNGTSKGTFTANSSTSPTIALTDTTYSAGAGLTLSGTTFSETFPIYYARPNETTATATLTATIGNFPSAYKDGIMIALRMPFNNVASSTLNVNGLGAKNVYYGNNTTTATRWGVSGCVALLVYETTTVSTGCWKAVYSWESGNSGTWDTNTNDRFKYGEAVVAGSLVAVGTDGLTWKIRSGKELRMPLVGGRSTGTFAVNGNYGQLAWSIRGIALTELTDTAKQGTAFTVPTWAIGNTIYLRGTIGSGGGFVADGTITNAISNPSSGTIAYVPIGFVEKTDNNNAVYMSLFMRDLDVFVIDTNGRVVSVNGKGIHASVSDSASSVAWANVSGKPTFATVATSGSYNDLSNKPTIPTVNNATLTIQKNGTNVQTFTANQSTNATANITVPTKTSDLTNDSGFATITGTEALTNKTYNGYTLGTACAKAYTDSSSASAIGTGTNLTTERDVYYGLPTINNAHNYTSNTKIYAPTGGGTSGQILKANGSTSTPTWVNQSSITSGACSGNSATATMMQYRSDIDDRSLFGGDASTDVPGYYEYWFSAPGATTNHVPIVTFGLSELNKNIWSPLASTGTDIIIIYGKVAYTQQQLAQMTFEIGYVLN